MTRDQSSVGASTNKLTKAGSLRAVWQVETSQVNSKQEKHGFMRLHDRVCFLTQGTNNWQVCDKLYTDMKY